MKATPEYKEEFLKRLGDRMIHSPNLEINNDLMKLFDDLALKWSTGMQSYCWHIYHENTVYSLVDGGYTDLNYCIKNNIDTIRAHEILSWFEEDEESTKKIDAELIDWSKKNPKVIKKENGIIVNERALKEGYETLKKYEMKDKDRKFTASDIYHGSNKKFEDILKKTLEKRENKMTYVELKLEEIESIKDLMKFDPIDPEYIVNWDNLFSINRYGGLTVATSGDPLIMSKEITIQLKDWLNKMFSPVESEE